MIFCMLISKLGKTLELLLQFLGLLSGDSRVFVENWYLVLLLSFPVLQ